MNQISVRKLMFYELNIRADKEKRTKKWLQRRLKYILKGEIGHFLRRSYRNPRAT